MYHLFEARGLRIHGQFYRMQALFIGTDALLLGDGRDGIANFH